MLSVSVHVKSLSARKKKVAEFYYCLPFMRHFHLTYTCASCLYGCLVGKRTEISMIRMTGGVPVVFQRRLCQNTCKRIMVLMKCGKMTIKFGIEYKFLYIR